MLEGECWKDDAERRMLAGGSWQEDAGRRMLEGGCWTARSVSNISLVIYKPHCAFPWGWSGVSIVLSEQSNPSERRKRFTEATPILRVIGEWKLSPSVGRSLFGKSVHRISFPPRIPLPYPPPTPSPLPRIPSCFSRSFRSAFHSSPSPHCSGPSLCLFVSRLQETMSFHLSSPCSSPAVCLFLSISPFTPLYCI